MPKNLFGVLIRWLRWAAVFEAERPATISWRNYHFAVLYYHSCIRFSIVSIGVKASVSKATYP